MLRHVRLPRGCESGELPRHFGIPPRDGLEDGYGGESGIINSIARLGAAFMAHRAVKDTEYGNVDSNMQAGVRAARVARGLPE